MVRFSLIHSRTGWVEIDRAAKHFFTRRRGDAEKRYSHARWSRSSSKRLFTPRKPISNWSAINIARIAELTKLGLMRPAGLRAFEKRREDKSSIYAYENAVRTLDPADEKKFRANRKAWQFFNAQAPSYRRVCIYWVTSAKKEETRARRLTTLIDDSTNGRRLGVVTLKPAKLSG